MGESQLQLTPEQRWLEPHGSTYRQLLKNIQLALCTLMFCIHRCNQARIKNTILHLCLGMRGCGEQTVCIIL